MDLWDLVESIYTGEEGVEKGESAGEEGGEKPLKVRRKRSKVDAPFKKMALTVELQENNYGVLSKKDYELVFTKGGGIIDFADYVSPKEKGSFKIKMKLGIPVSEAEEFFVFYWSNAKVRKISGDIYGSSCNRFYDITRFFKNRAFSRGLAATTLNLKYITSLAGTYFFVIKKEGALHIAHLTLKDSRYRILHCRD